MRASGRWRPRKRSCVGRSTLCALLPLPFHLPRHETFPRLSGWSWTCHGNGHMAEHTATLPTVATHGATRLPLVDVDSYNVELKDDEGFLGDRASKGAFRKILETLRKPLKKNG